MVAQSPGLPRAPLPAPIATKGRVAPQRAHQHGFRPIEVDRRSNRSKERLPHAELCRTGPRALAAAALVRGHAGPADLGRSTSGAGVRYSTAHGFHRFVVLATAALGRSGHSRFRGVRHEQPTPSTTPVPTPVRRARLYEARTAWPGGGPTAGWRADRRYRPGRGRPQKRRGRPRVPRSDIDTILTNTCGSAMPRPQARCGQPLHHRQAGERLVSQPHQRDVDETPR